MPCFSNIETTLIDLKFIKAAAEELGIKVKMQNENAYYLEKGREHLTLQRDEVGAKFYVQSYSGSNNILDEIVNPLTASYTKAVTVDFYKRKGYTVTNGKKPGELVFTKY